MVNNISKIASHFFRKESLDAISENELRYFITQYPYVGAGHLLLAKKLQLSGEKRAFEREVAVTSVYFTNPAWLEFILREDAEDSMSVPAEISATESLDIRAADADPVDDVSITLNETVQPGFSHTHQFVVDESISQYPGPGNEADTTNSNSEFIISDVDTNSVTIDEDLPPVQENSLHLATPEGESAFVEATAIDPGEGGDKFTVESDMSDSADEIAAENAAILLDAEDAADSMNVSAAETAEILLDVEDISDEVDESAAETATILLKAEATTEAIEENAAETAEILLEAEAIAEEVDENAAETANILLEAESMATAVDDQASKPGILITETGQAGDDDVYEESKTADSEIMTHAAMLHISRAGEEAMRAAAGSDNGKLAFDPYHTIDYFASQGIKLKLDDLNKDKLGLQLKSFTEWIRSMKRLPANISDSATDDHDQHSIRKIAEHSIEGRDVLTESMAEVWAKQGNFDKARLIYQKLSLQNPSKSTYFAAKIDQLKAL